MTDMCRRSNKTIRKSVMTDMTRCRTSGCTRLRTFMMICIAVAMCSVSVFMVPGCVVVDKEERIVPRHGNTYPWPEQEE